MAVLAVIGLGEAGAALARDLSAAGAAVRGFDLAVPAVDGVEIAPSAGEAAHGAEAVLSVNAASAAEAVAAAVAPALAAGALFADLNTASPGAKRALAAIVGRRGARFADVALMAPVAGRGLRTPVLASGDGAERFAELVGGLGMPVTLIGAEPGDAAAVKLVRSVFMKGLAAACIESVRAAQAAGCEDWMHAEIADVLSGADAALLERLLTGSERHATRRIHEVRDAQELLAELGVEGRVSAAAEGWLRELEGEGRAAAAEGGLREPERER